MSWYGFNLNIEKETHIITSINTSNFDQKVTLILHIIQHITKSIINHFSFNCTQSIFYSRGKAHVMQTRKKWSVLNCSNLSFSEHNFNIKGK